MRHIEELETPERISSQQKAWQYEKVGWALMFIGIVCAILGLLGGAGYFHDKAKASENISVRYERFGRFKSPGNLEITITNPPKGQIDLHINTHYINNFTINNIAPTPRNVSFYNNNMTYSFVLEKESPEITIKFDLTNESIGLVRGNVTYDHHDVPIKQFIYP